MNSVRWVVRLNFLTSLSRASLPKEGKVVSDREEREEETRDSVGQKIRKATHVTSAILFSELSSS